MGSDDSTLLTDLADIRQTAERIRHLHLAKRNAQPGDWLAAHAEPGQTFAEYLHAKPAPAVDRYSAIYVEPIGQFTETQRRIVGLSAELLSRVYGASATILAELPLKLIPPSARRLRSTGAQQIHTRYVLDDVLLRSRPDDALAFLALTTLDLWPGLGWNFVFGEALVGERVDVWSMHRYGDPDASAEAYVLCLRRTLKVAIHETGHMLGLLHCTAYECCMNGSNHLQEMDGRPMAFCPECASKVWWACRLKPVAWFASLEEFAQRNAFAPEAEFWRMSGVEASLPL